jgi:hypothetical protein
MGSTSRPTVICPGYDHDKGGGHVDCGNTLYEATYSYASGKPLPVWKCTNCNVETARHTRHRPTNRARAMDAWKQLKAEWKDTDAALAAIVEAGSPSGCLLAHGSTWNWQLDKLLDSKNKLSLRDIRYHTTQGRADLERAKAFVESKKGVAK